MEIVEVINKLREESLYVNNASLNVMDLCMEAADLLEQQAEIIVQWQDTAKVAVHNEIKVRQELEAITKDRDQWRVAAEASRDVIQPKLRAEIAELKASQPVRCEDCKYSSWASGDNSDECPMNLCRLKRIFGKEDVDPNDCCSYGERRVEE